MIGDFKNYLGDLELGRDNLGDSMPVLVYRLFEFTMKEVITDKYGKDVAIELFRDAGRKAGMRFTAELLDTSLIFNEFIEQLERMMLQLKMGILRIEEADLQKQHIIITVSEDLDCSGLPVIGEAVCNYDEGFLTGVLEAYTGNIYQVIETDCWAKGGRVCRFDAKLQ